MFPLLLFLSFSISQSQEVQTPFCHVSFCHIKMWRVCETSGFPAGYPEFGGRPSHEIRNDEWRIVMGTYINHDLDSYALIYLIENGAGRRLVSYAGGPWHGTWYMIQDPPILKMEFDCKAREDRPLKTTTLFRAPSACSRGGWAWVGRDRRGNHITVRWNSAMIYNGERWNDLAVQPPPSLTDASI